MDAFIIVRKQTKETLGRIMYVMYVCMYVNTCILGRIMCVCMYVCMYVIGTPFINKCKNVTQKNMKIKMKTYTPNPKWGVEVVWCELTALAKRVTDLSLIVIGTVR